MRLIGDLLYWQSNDEWWTIDEKTNQFVLTEKSTEEAKVSFEKYLKDLETHKVFKDEKPISKVDFINKYRNGENMKCPECGNELKHTQNRKTTRYIYCEKCGFKIIID